MTDAPRFPEAAAYAYHRASPVRRGAGGEEIGHVLRTGGRMFGVRNDAEVDRIGEACGGKEGQAGDCKAVFGGRGLHLMRLRLTQLIGQAVVGHDEGTDIGKLLAAHPGRFWGIFSRMASASPSELLMASRTNA